MASDVVTSYLRAADVAVALIAQAPVAARWCQGSVLEGLSVGAVAAHLARAVLQVEWLLDAPAPGGPLISAATYYAQLEGTSVAASQLNIGVRSRSDSAAQQGPAALVAQAQASLARLHQRLLREPAHRRVAVAHRPGQELVVEEYLKTRCVELAVHTEDLAISVGSSVRAPGPAVGIAADVLVQAARQRHGDAEVLHALARRERDTSAALQVL